MEKYAQVISIETPLAAAMEENIYIYGGYPFSNPEQDCEKILVWFNDHITLSEEQALHELKIGNLPARIAELLQRRYLIHSLLLTSEVTPTYSHNFAIYGLQRYMPISRPMPQFFQATKVGIENGNLLLPKQLTLVDLNTAAGDMFQDMQTSSYDLMVAAAY